MDSEEEEEVKKTHTYTLHTPLEIMGKRKDKSNRLEKCVNVKTVKSCSRRMERRSHFSIKPLPWQWFKLNKCVKCQIEYQSITGGQLDTNKERRWRGINIYGKYDGLVVHFWHFIHRNNQRNNWSYAKTSDIDRCQWIECGRIETIFWIQSTSFNQQHSGRQNINDVTFKVMNFYPYFFVLLVAANKRWSYKSKKASAKW